MSTFYYDILTTIPPPKKKAKREQLIRPMLHQLAVEQEQNVFFRVKDCFLFTVFYDMTFYLPPPTHPSGCLNWAKTARIRIASG